MEEEQIPVEQHQPHPKMADGKPRQPRTCSPTHPRTCSPPHPSTFTHTHYDDEDRSGNLMRPICAAIAILLLLAGVTALVVWLVYRPEKPRFTVEGAAIYDFNTTSPPLISTTMQFTIVARNPNKRVSIYYDRLTAFVSYHNQAITAPVSLPPLYQGKRSTVAMSPVIGGGPVAVSAEVGNGLAVDEAYGVVGLRVVVLGRLRWKAGAIRTGHYGVSVKCDVLLGLKKGTYYGGQVPLLASPGCTVNL